MPRRRPTLKFALAAALLLAFAAGCAGMVSPLRHLLATAENTPARAALTPPVLAAGHGQGPVKTPADWRARRETLLTLFTQEIYGAPPPPAEATSTIVETLSAPDWVGDGRLELHDVQLAAPGGPAAMTLAVLKPEGAMRGVFLIPSDCGLRPLFSDPRLPAPDAYRMSWCDSEDGLGGPPAGLTGAVFGAHVITPPLDRILQRGYAVAAWHESEIAPDSEALHAETLARLGLDPDAADRPGVLTLWAWTVSAAIDVLRADPAFGDTPIFAYGHSRRGKAVLLAGARDPRIDLVLAHQSGTAGAAPHGDMTGEPVRSMARRYPHWFAPAYQRWANGPETEIPVNQHQLIALMAPRAVHFGGANRDTWADPAGADAAARAAAPAWRLYGVDPDAKLSSHLRPGAHGVRAEDWDAFLTAADRVAAQ